MIFLSTNCRKQIAKEGPHMKVIGIIAEYNPFHNGHKYQIEEIKKQTNADYVIIAMSGNFLQRGVPAMLDKHTRARMALMEGADLVLELPTIWSTASAEFFANGGVSLLKSTGVVDILCFGAETNKLSALNFIASYLIYETPEFKEKISNYQKSGFSYPEARNQALLESMKQSPFSKKEIETILSTPNNILGIEYLKALINQKTSISPFLIERKGNGYHSLSMENGHASASAIRNYLASSSDEILSEVKKQMPSNAYNILSSYIADSNPLLSEDELSSILGYRLLELQTAGFSHFADCNNDLSNRICNALANYVSFSDFCNQLKTKEITYTRISRCLLHILLNITQADYDNYRQNPTPYLRILGFKKSANSLLTEINNHGTSPLVTKVADASKILDDYAYSLFEKDLFATNLYNMIRTSQSGHLYKNDFTKPIEII